MTEVVVSHRGGSYPVRIGRGVLDELPAFLGARFAGARRVVIADATVAATLPLPVADAELLTFPPGEEHKTREQWLRLTDAMLARRLGRDTVVIALGGGVTTDLAGFVAATFLRGVPWIAVPTTTLGMLDAAVGGKTGVDTPAGKNLVGAFHPPAAVFIDPATLATLPARTFREGLAEAVKHAAILDADYGEWIVRHAARILEREADAVAHLVRRSVELKAGVVAGDETEGGRRAILNAGHTIGHALEQATDFLIPHGEAVAIGLVLETRIAEADGIAAGGTHAHLLPLLAALGLPVTAPRGLDISRMLAAMRSDKKNRGGTVRAALLSRFGDVASTGNDWTCPLNLDRLPALLES